jgi:serralysin
MTTQDNSIAGSGYGNVFIDSLIWGCAWSGTSISYSFRSGYGSLYPLYPVIDSIFYGDGWYTSERDAFVSAFSSYSAVCNLTFTQSSDNNASANIGLWSVNDATMSNLSPGTAGVFFPPNGTFSQSPGGFNYEATGWFDFSPGSYASFTIIHELGHALGLAHPHDGGGENDATLFPGVTSSSSLGTNNLNQGI